MNASAEQNLERTQQTAAWDFESSAWLSEMGEGRRNL